MSEKVGILTHRDTDGICSAALALAAYPKAEIEFDDPFNLVQRLRTLPNWDTAIILDLGIDRLLADKAVDAFREASKLHKIIYIDHHLLPPGITKRSLKCSGALVHKTGVSASELALNFFKPLPHLEHIALMGAIGDYQQNTPKMRKLAMKYGWRTAFLEMYLLEEALEVSRGDVPYCRKIVGGLAQGLWPSEIPGLIIRVQLGMSQEVMLKEYVRKNSKKIGKGIVLVTDVPFMATGKAASHAVFIKGAKVGIATFRDGDWVRLSMRRDGMSKLNLNDLINKIASRVGGSGGGHAAAAGGRVPVEKFDDFLRMLKSKVR
jgi:single-stranded-DNA-specific exonuclease